MKKILLLLSALIIIISNGRAQNAPYDIFIGSTNILSFSWASNGSPNPDILYTAGPVTTGSPYEGTDHFLLDYKTYSYYAGGAFNVDGWSGTGLNWSGYTHMKYVYKGTGDIAGTKLQFQLNDPSFHFGSYVDIIPNSSNATYQDGLVDLSTFLGGSFTNLNTVNGIAFTISGGPVATGQFYLDAIQLYDYSLPTITSLSTSSGSAGDVITVTGTNFNYVTTVKIGSVIATVSNLTSTSFDITVPVGASTGKVKITNPGGTTQSASNFNIVAGIAGKNNSIDFSVGPNPSAGIYTINSEEQIDEVIVSDCMGNIISSNSNLAVDLTNQPEGIYFLKVISGEKSDIKKLVKNK
jgi:hypothetical protein